jgi:hypothetical protein
LQLTSKEKTINLLLHKWDWLLGLLTSSCPSTSRSLTLLTLLNHWHKEIWHRSPAGPHTRHKLLLIPKPRLIKVQRLQKALSSEKAILQN